jgi:hypothetical protein
MCRGYGNGLFFVVVEAAGVVKVKRLLVNSNQSVIIFFKKSQLLASYKDFNNSHSFYFLRENNLIPLTKQIISIISFIMLPNPKRIKQKRFRSKWIIPFIYLGFFAIAINDDKLMLSGAFFMVGLTWFIFYPVLEKHRYIKHFRGFIRENLSKQFNEQITLEFNDSTIQ